MSNLANIIEKLQSGALDIDGAVAELKRVGVEPLENKVGPRDSYAAIVADPDGGVRAKGAGSVLAAAFSAKRINKEQYGALANALIS